MLFELQSLPEAQPHGEHAETYNRFRQRLALIPLEGKIASLPGDTPLDGNCLFVAFQHHRGNLSREATVEHMRSNKDRYLPWVALADLVEGEFPGAVAKRDCDITNSPGFWDKYCDWMSNDGVYGTGVEIFAMCSSVIE